MENTHIIADSVIAFSQDIIGIISYTVMIDNLKRQWLSHCLRKRERERKRQMSK